MKLFHFCLILAAAQFGYIVALHKHGIPLARWDVLELLVFVGGAVVSRFWIRLRTLRP